MRRSRRARGERRRRRRISGERGEEDTRVFNVRLVFRIIHKLLLCCSLSRGDARDEESKERDEEGRENKKPLDAVERTGGEEEHPPPLQKLTHVVGMTHVLPETSVADETSVFRVVSPTEELNVRNGLKEPPSEEENHPKNIKDAKTGLKLRTDGVDDGKGEDGGKGKHGHAHKEEKTLEHVPSDAIKTTIELVYSDTTNKMNKETDSPKKGISKEKNLTDVHMTRENKDWNRSSNYTEW